MKGPSTAIIIRWSNVKPALYMGKGDGKRKRKKKIAGGGSLTSSPASSSASTTPPSPMRVTSDSNIPVRHQIRWGKLNKEYRNQVNNPGFRQKRVVRTKYRRAWAEDEIEQKAEERKRKGQDPDWDVILNRTTTNPLVIVDGYNIISKWARLKKHMTKGDLMRARQLLVDDLENLSSLKRWRIEVVFDGTRRSTVGPLGHGPGGSNGAMARPAALDQATKASVSKHGVRVVFSGVGREADAYIEARCAQAKNVTEGALTGQFIVASDDSMIRLAGQNAGAWCMGADRFVSELKALRKAVAYRVEAAMAKVNGETPSSAALTSRGTSGQENPRPVRFGRRSVMIEDKRNRKKKTEDHLTNEQLDLELNITVEQDVDENGVPWWAQLPNTTIRCA